MRPGRAPALLLLLFENATSVCVRAAVERGDEDDTAGRTSVSLGNGRRRGRPPARVRHQRHHPPLQYEPNYRPLQQAALHLGHQRRAAPPRWKQRRPGGGGAAAAGLPFVSCSAPISVSPSLSSALGRLVLSFKGI